MITRNNIAKRKHALGLIIGLLAAVLILFTQSFYYEYVAISKEQIKAEQTDKANDTEAAILKAAPSAVSQVVQVTLQHAWQLISIISFDDARTHQINYTPSLHQNTLFRTLFRLIISPNAP